MSTNKMKACMIGSNQLLLNQATIIEALQLWLTKEIPVNTPIVTSVKMDKSSSYNDTFIVDIKNEIN